MKKIQKGDTVQVMRGKDAGKQGEVLKVISKTNKRGKDVDRVVVKGINIVKKAEKPNPQLNIPGGITEFESPIDVSNVMYFDTKAKAPSRVGVKVDEKTGKKVRYAKKSGQII